MKGKWALIDIVTLVLLLIMAGAVVKELVEVSKINLSPKETVEVSFVGFYGGKEIDMDESFEGSRLSHDKDWLSASIVSVENADGGTTFAISGSGTRKSGETFMGNQVLKVGKEFMLETERLKIPITILEIEKTGE